MYLRRVILRNIQGLDRLDFDFQRPGGTQPTNHAGWNVVVGDNASGKSALLKAIALAIVGPDNARILQPAAAGWIREGEPSATIALQLVAGPGDRWIGQGGHHEKSFWAELPLARQGSGVVSVRAGKRYIGRDKDPTRGPWADAPEGWYAVGYGPFRRLDGHSPAALSTRGVAVRFATLFRQDATLAGVNPWLKHLSHRALEGHESDRVVLKKMLAVLNQHLLQHATHVDRVDSRGLWLRQPDGAERPLQAMDDGYRAAIAMVVDMIRQLLEVHGPGALAEMPAAEPAITHDGIVLIDEVEAHLHPIWQREIGEWFKRIFPNMQFIVTTHSPFICQAADANGLFVLPPPGQGREPHRIEDAERVRIIASRPDAIYRGPAFGLEDTYPRRADGGVDTLMSGDCGDQ